MKNLHTFALVNLLRALSIAGVRFGVRNQSAADSDLGSGSISCPRRIRARLARRLLHPRIGGTPYDPGVVTRRPCGMAGGCAASVTGTALPATIMVMLFADAVIFAAAV